MKLLILSDEGKAHFGLLNTVPGLEILTPANPAQALEMAKQADVIYGKPTQELLDAAPNVKWYQAPSAGVDFVHKMPGFAESDVVLTNTKGAHAPSIAEHAFSLLLALTRGLPATGDWQKQKHWGRDAGYRMPKEIRGGTVGIIGYGAIGHAIAGIARAFGMDVRALDRHVRPGDEFAEHVDGIDELHSVLGQSDVVMVTAPYTPETHHLIDEQAFNAMKRGAYLIVVSRGGIVDEDALVKALEDGRVAGAGLDVLENEPLPEASPLWGMPNVIITPHLAGSSDQKERRCVEILVDNLKRYGRGEPLNNVVDKRLGF
jgi:phosphoglycerate dehydrogenase-like enzyme